MSLYRIPMPVPVASNSGGCTAALDESVDVLRAIGEPTRLRIVAALRGGDLTVTDLTEILGQSQPRVSRHLKLLADAAVITKQREGSWAFFRLVDAEPVGGVVAAVLERIAVDDPTLVNDRARLDEVRQRRADDAERYFESIAVSWDEERAMHAEVGAVERAITEIVGSGQLGRVVDLGTGTGRMLQLLATDAERAVGIDASHSMLSVARANLDDERLRHCELRQGDVYRPPADAESFDLAVIHQVLHYLDDPERAVVEASRLLVPAGRLVIVDFAAHHHEFLRSDHAHRRLGFSHDQLREYVSTAGLEVEAITDLSPPAGADGLTVTICSAGKPRRASRLSSGLKGVA